MMALASQPDDYLTAISTAPKPRRIATVLAGVGAVLIDHVAVFSRPLLSSMESGGIETRLGWVRWKSPIERVWQCNELTDSHKANEAQAEHKAQVPSPAHVEE